MSALPPKTDMCGVTDPHHLGFPEHEARSNGRVDHLVAERRTRKVVETVAGAMRSNQIVWVDSPKFIDRLVDVVVAEWRHHMEAANDSVHLVDARGFLRLAHSIDHAAVAARSKHHQALILDHVSGANLVLEIVRDISCPCFCVAASF